jgi:hypothetical protein
MVYVTFFREQDPTQSGKVLKGGETSEKEGII